MFTNDFEKYYVIYNNWVISKPPFYKFKARKVWHNSKPIILPIRGSFKYQIVTKDEAKRLGY